MTTPARVAAALARASDAGFTQSSEPEVGRLLAALAAGVPASGRILEIGTGAGVGTAWLVEGLGTRTDVEVVSVESDATRAKAVREGEWPAFVNLIEDDVMRVLETLGFFDLVFADAQAGKFTSLDRTIAALAPGGALVVDDMHAGGSLSADLHAVRDTLLAHPSLAAAELQHGTGVIVAVRRDARPVRMFATGAFVFDADGRVLLVRENYGRRRWGPPGGAAEPGESPHAAVVRETLEETGVAVEVDGLVGVVHGGGGVEEWTGFGFACRIVSGSPSVPASGEIAEVGWFDPADPPKPLTPLALRFLADAAAGRRGVVS